jgi:hypothetical protein
VWKKCGIALGISAAYVEKVWNSVRNFHIMCGKVWNSVRNFHIMCGKSVENF